MPNQRFKPAAGIEYEIRAFMAECEACQDVMFTGVQWHEFDEIGCNWNIEWMSGHRVDVDACTSSIKEKVDELRSKFFISDPE